MVLGIALTSCSREDNNEIINPTNPIATNPPVEIKMLPKIIDYGIRQNILTYDNDVLTKFRWAGTFPQTYSNSDLTYGFYGMGDYTYEYNSDRTLKRSIYVYEGFREPLIFLTEYHYENSGTIRAETYMTYKENPDPTRPPNMVKFYEAIYTMENGNLIKEIATAYEVYLDANRNRKIATHTTTYEYDTKNSPTTHLKGFSALNLEHHHQYKKSSGGDIFIAPNSFKNNAIKHKTIKQTFDYNGNISSTQELEPVIYHYEYNEQNYPTKITFKNEDLFNNILQEDVTIKISY